MFDLTGKTALVTGATGGIGAALARALHAQGAYVVLSGTREAVLQERATELGARTAAVPANLSASAAVDGLVEAAEAAAGDRRGCCRQAAACPVSAPLRARASAPAPRAARRGSRAR